MVFSWEIVSSSLQPHGLWSARPPCPWDYPGKSIGVGRHFLLPGFFPTQGSNPRLLLWQADSLPLSHQRSPYPSHKYDHMLKVLGRTPSPTSWRPSCVACDSKPFATFLDLLPAFSPFSCWLLWATYSSLNMSRSLSVRSNFRRGLKNTESRPDALAWSPALATFTPCDFRQDSLSLYLQVRVIPTSRIFVRNEWAEIHSTQYVSV